MRMRTLLRTFMVGALLLGVAGPAAAACEPDGEVQFLCGPVNTEDLAPIPESPWVIVSSMVDGGDLHLADTRDNTTTVLFSPATGAADHDTATYGDCPGTRDEPVSAARLVPACVRRHHAHPARRRARRTRSD